MAIRRGDADMAVSGVRVVLLVLCWASAGWAFVPACPRTTPGIRRPGVGRAPALEIALCPSACADPPALCVSSGGATSSWGGEVPYRRLGAQCALLSSASSPGARRRWVRARPVRVWRGVSPSPRPCRPMPCFARNDGKRLCTVHVRPASTAASATTRPDASGARLFPGAVSRGLGGWDTSTAGAKHACDS